jgi:outer membrane protein TolC
MKRAEAVIAPAIVLVCALAAAVFLPCARAEEPANHGPHGHGSVTENPSLTLSQTLDTALQEYPETQVLAARSELAEAWVDRGGDWLAERPSLSVRYQTDRWQNDNRLEEYEAGIFLPLWSWGGRSATRSLGDALRTEFDAASESLRWEVAGRLRATLWELALAAEELHLAEETLEVAARVAETVGRRHELGDAALREALLAQSAELEAQTRLLDAQAGLVDAEWAYRSLTGLNQHPPFSAETLSSRLDILPAHPALILADAEIQRAEAAVSLADTRSSDGPSLLMGPRRERAANTNSFDDSIGITVNVPFGPSGQRRTSVAEARRDLAATNAAKARIVRVLNLERHEAAHTLSVIRESLPPARRQAELAQRQQRMGLLAYEKGEIELVELLRLQGMSLAATRRSQQLAIEASRQIAFYNQAVGELP